MKAVQVRYTVQENYVDQNKINIKKVTDALIAKPIDGMLYSSYTIDDGNTFVHINISKDGETMSKLSALPEFQNFRQQLKESQPLSPPKATPLELVGAGFEL